MKKYVLLFVTSLLVMVLHGQQGSLIYSTDNGKNCIIRVTPGKIYDNKFDVDFSASWVNDEMKPLKDASSVVCFETNKIKINEKDFVSLNSTKNVVTFNVATKVTFDINDEFLGSTIEVEFPFQYAANLNDATLANGRSEFVFKRPRQYKAVVSVMPGDIIDKTAPSLTYLLPEGVDNGLKPIVYEPFVKVKIQSSDFFGIASIKVNNIDANQTGDSIYELDVPLKPGYENNVMAVITDKSGHVTQKGFKVECRKSQNQPQLMATVAQAANSAVSSATKRALISDVDTGIPSSGVENSMRFALIFGNEDYTSYQTGLRSEMNVDFAVHDAEVFKEYANKVLGVPESNIIFLKNAKVLEMHKSISKLNSLMKNTHGEGEFFVYYAGHGFPDEVSKEPYLIPVDVSGSDLDFAIKLNEFYQKLSEFPSKRVTVFIDACFSGGGRAMGLMAARGVKIKPIDNIIKGNLIVFSASTGEQSSLPYKEKGHGIFTYHLLQKLKETGGNITYAELSEYLNSSVSIRSVIVNGKEQNPQTNISNDILGKWKTWNMIK